MAESGHINIINDGSIARYDWNTDSHGHLKCKVCDNLVDVQLVNDELISKVEKKFEFDVDDVEMTIIGTCSKHN